MEFSEVKITTEPLSALTAVFSSGHGAVVDFFGVVRSIENDRLITGIRYEAFQEMAQRQLELIAAEVKDRFRLGSVVIHHRIGLVLAGEASLLVRVTACHRRAAFDGCREIIERLKAAVPIWKHPIYANAQVA